MDGAETARAGLVLFTDMECPFCRAFAATALPAVRESYVDTGRLFIVLRHLPIERIHPNAVGFARTVECARRQGRGWEVHDRIISGLSSNTVVVDSLLLQFGLDARRFDTCMAGDSGAFIKRDLALARELGITSTPTVLYGVRERESLRVMDAGVGAEPLQVVLRRIETLVPTVTALH
jgi:protein-disulfide isomerase